MEIGHVWRYIDKEVVKPQFYMISNFSEDFTFVSTDWHRGYYINTEGKKVDNLNFVIFDSINGQPDRSRNFQDGLAAFFQGDYACYVFIDKNFILVIQPQFSHVCDFSDGLSAVFTEDKDLQGCDLCYIDKTGKFVIQPQFYSADNFDNNNIAFVSDDYSNEKCINNYGNVISIHN